MQGGTLISRIWGNFGEDISSSVMLDGSALGKVRKLAGLYEVVYIAIGKGS